MNEENILKLLWIAAGIILAFAAWQYIAPMIANATPTTPAA